MKKRIIALVLSLSMIFSLTVSAYAETDTNTTLTACEECGGTESHKEACSKYVEQIEKCEECGETESHKDTCSKYVEPVKKCEECGEKEGHTENCSYSVRGAQTCEKCGQEKCTCNKQSSDVETEVPVVNSAIKEEVTPAESAALEETDITANIYVENEGIYEEISEYSKDRPLDMKEYNGKTVYVLSSDAEQNIYFKSKSFTGIVGSLFWLNSKECATLTSGENVALGAQSATVTLKAAVPAETEVVLYAKKFLTEDYTVTIKVLDKLPEKEPDTEKPEPSTEVIVGENTFTSDVPMTVSVTAKEKQDLIENALEFSDEKEYYYFDIHAEESTEITVDGLVDKEKAERAILTVHHLLDGADSIANAISSGLGTDYFITEDAVQFAEEVAAGKEYSRTDENRVYYTYQGAEVDNEGNVNFTAYSFSSFIFIVDYDEADTEYKVEKSEVLLSEVLTNVQSDKTTADIVDVETSDSSLVSITVLGDDWKLTLNDSLNAEAIRITFKDGETMVIRISNSKVYYYLPDTEWDMGTERSATITPKSKDPLIVDFKNSKPITVDEIKNNSDITVYVRPGMALGVASGTSWPDGSWSASKYPGDYEKTQDGWTWIWDGSVNYAVADKVTSPKTCAPFELKVGTHTCTVTLVILPESTLVPNLMEDVLKGNDNYSIGVLPVTLYNYNGKNFNEKYYENYIEEEKLSTGWVAFAGSSAGESANMDSKPWAESSLAANGGGSVALMGIMKNQLVNKLPETSVGQNVDLFSAAEFDGKEVYQDVNFQFIYNKSTGYYTYNSELNHAQYDAEKNTIKLYEQSFSPTVKATGDQNSRAGFYPFSDINQALWHDVGSGLSLEERLQHQATDFGKTYSADSNDVNIRYADYAGGMVTSSTAGSPVDMHFGLQMEVKFYFNNDRKADNGDTLLYSFTGDDDLWVYIDDQLVLDIGGGHTKVSGTIDFTNGKVWTEKYTKLDGAHGGSYTTEEYNKNQSVSGYSDGKKIFVDNEFLKNLETDQMHTMRVFYLERHSGESNCRMHFNLPVVPNNTVSVTKELVNQDGKQVSITPDEEYTFKVYKADDTDDSVNKKEFTVLKNYPYTIQGDDTTYYTSSTDGTFKLKAGQTANFSNIERFTEVYVVEEKTSNDYVYTKCVTTDADSSIEYYENDYTVNHELKTPIKVMPNGAIAFKFTNYMQTQPLTIEKTVAGGTDGLIDPKQKFTFNLDFTKNIVEKGRDEIKTADDTPLTDGGSFELAHGESITIPRVPVNMTYTLSENNPDTANDSFDNPNFKLEVGTKKVKEQILEFAKNFENKISEDSTKQKNENKITVQNLQRFDLKITKRISGEETTDQSFRFTVKGEDNHNKATDLEVVIPASAFKADTDTSEKDAAASAVIPNVPVGKYTVSEDTAWSWRYLLDGQKDVTVAPTGIGLPEHVVEFKNNRSNIYWLDGNSWCQNIFIERNIVKTQTTDNPEKPTVDN